MGLQGATTFKTEAKTLQLPAWSYQCGRPAPSCRPCPSVARGKPEGRMNNTERQLKLWVRTLLVPKLVERVEMAMREHKNLRKKGFQVLCFVF